MQTDSPIRVFFSDASWRVNYGSYISSFHQTRVEAIATARIAAALEQRLLEIEPPGYQQGSAAKAAAR